MLRGMKGLVTNLARQVSASSGMASAISCVKDIVFVFKRQRGAASVITLSGGASIGREAVAVFRRAIISTAASRGAKGSPTPIS